MGGVHFCARLSAFKVLGLFFCNSIDPSPRIDRAPEISKSAEIFGKDCEIQVTLHILENSYIFNRLYAYIENAHYYFVVSHCYHYRC